MKHRWIARAVLLLAFAAAVAPAATIVVTSDSGGHDVVGVCTLRDAITLANTGNPTGGCAIATAAAAADSRAQPDCLCTDNTIVLPTAATITLTEVDDATVNTGLPIISTSLSIAGNASTIRRDPALGCNRNGATDAGEFALIQTSSPLLALNDLTLSDGCADSADYLFAKGGAISNSGSLVLQNVTVRDNFASNRGGALYGASGSMTITDSTVAGNASLSGGGVFVEGAATILTINRSLFRQNAAGQYFGGGAIVAGLATTATIINSTFSANSAGNDSAIEADGVVAVSSSTFADNVATGGGGAAFQISSTGDGQLARIKNSLFAANIGGAGNCRFAAGTVAIEGINLSSDDSCTGFALNDTDAKLGSLAANGGPTLTYALTANSPAVDAVVDCTDTAGFTITTDQRGTIRPYAFRDPAQPLCDIGAYELGDAIFGDGFESPPSATSASALR